MKKQHKIVLVMAMVLLLLVALRFSIVGKNRQKTSMNSVADQNADSAGAALVKSEAEEKNELLQIISDEASPRESLPDPLVEKLQALLDDDANREKTLRQAVAMTYGTEVQQRAAIDAFRWLGGREAKKALIRLRKEAYPATAEEAGRVLTHLLTEGLYIGREQKPLDDTKEETEVEESKVPEETEQTNFAEIENFDAAIWEEAILEAPQDMDREELLILMSAFPGTKSVPVLLNLLESENTEIREHALEYLEFVTYGEKITNRQQGEDWLAKNGAMENFAP